MMKKSGIVIFLVLVILGIVLFWGITKLDDYENDNGAIKTEDNIPAESDEGQEGLPTPEL